MKLTPLETIIQDTPEEYQLVELDDYCVPYMGKFESTLKLIDSVTECEGAKWLHKDPDINAVGYTPYSVDIHVAIATLVQPGLEDYCAIYVLHIFTTPGTHTKRSYKSYPVRYASDWARRCLDHKDCLLRTAKDAKDSPHERDDQWDGPNGIVYTQHWDGTVYHHFEGDDNACDYGWCDSPFADPDMYSDCSTCGKVNCECESNDDPDDYLQPPDNSVVTICPACKCGDTGCATCYCVNCHNNPTSEPVDTEYDPFAEDDDGLSLDEMGRKYNREHGIPEYFDSQERRWFIDGMDCRGEDINGVHVVSICTWEDSLSQEDQNLPYIKRGKILMEWCERNGAHYYARPRENFDLNEAVEEAKMNDCYILVVEDMS